jgi:hypothetical protein
MSEDSTRVEAPTNSSSPAKIATELKDAGRQSRLSIKKFEEHQLRTEFKSIAIERCKDQVQAFGKCASDNGLMVVFRCRDFLKRMNACMEQQNSNEEFQKYKDKHRPDLTQKSA